MQHSPHHTARAPRTYSSAEACALAGLSYRQLDYWQRIGTMTAHTPARGSGSRRQFTAQQVFVLAVLRHVSSLVRISDLEELAALLLDWDAEAWGDVLLVSRGQVWHLGSDESAPAVGVAVNLPVIAREVAARAAELDA